MKNLRFVCAQPATLYYAWQVEDMINIFINMGVDPNSIDIVAWAQNEIISEEWEKLKNHYKNIKFFFYNDTRITKNYISSIRPNILKQHWKNNPQLEKEAIFYHDCDIAFTKPISEWITEEMINDENWYGSDTRWYIAHSYIKSKGDDVIKKMCEIVDIEESVVEQNELNSIGAQYIMKGVTSDFWERVEGDSERLFKEITDLNNDKVIEDRRTMPPGEERTPYHPLQIWCADMWAVLWNGWKMGKNTICHPNLEFSWGTSSDKLWEECNIFHNAGVVNSTSGLFFKSDFINKLPYGETINIKEGTTSYEYWQIIQKVGKRSALINEKIKQQFQTYKIHQMQLDPYGVCNAKCWFCPVKYKGNPTNGKEVMSPELLRKIIRNLIDEREKPDGLVHKNFGGFYTAHYNEILLYPHFEELLKICQEYRLCFMVLSNGIPLTPERVDLIVKYKGVVNGICLNIPAFEPEIWSLRSGINIKQFDKLISNVKYAMEQLPNMVENKSFSIQVNGSNENSFIEKGGWLNKGPNFPSDMDLNIETGELAQQAKKAKELFKGLQIFDVPHLIDRAGLLDEIMTNKPSIERNLMGNDITKKVIGCGNGREVGGRPVGWIHINGAGKAFLCCNDYDMEIEFGDFKTQELSDFWGKAEHIKQIEKSYETICRNCASAIYEK